jgi:formate dehydrogenase subunit delta
MDSDHLVKMANEIATFYEVYPDRSEAISAIAMHVKNFWEPRMRREIIEHVREHGGSDLKELAREAVLTLRESAPVR